MPTYFDTHGIDVLPDPRADGLCANCKRKDAKTTDRRFCVKCLRYLVARLNPAPRAFGSGRTGDHAQAWDGEPSPWGENATRALEGD